MKMSKRRKEKIASLPNLSFDLKNTKNRTYRNIHFQKKKDNKIYLRKNVELFMLSNIFCLSLRKCIYKLQ